jgi:ribosomal protein S18
MLEFSEAQIDMIDRIHEKGCHNVEWRKWCGKAYSQGNIDVILWIGLLSAIGYLDNQKDSLKRYVSEDERWKLSGTWQITAQQQRSMPWVC